MRNLYFWIALILPLFILFGCTDVDNGERGVVFYPYSKGLDATKVYDEGTYFGFSWLWNDMITYQIRQQTLNIEVELLDKNSMSVGVTASVMLRPIPDKIGYLHEEKGPDYVETYCKPVAEGILKDIVGSYTAQELVTSARQEAQTKIRDRIIELYTKNHIMCDDVLIRDIDLPPAVTKAITDKQVQEENNLLAEKKKVQEENLAAAAVAKAKGQAEAKIIEAQGQAKYIQQVQAALANSPQYVELKKVEKWNGSFGEGNIFGEGMPFINVRSNKK